MKTKGNRKKPQPLKRPGPKRPDVPSEWLYLVPGETTLRDIYELFKEETSCRAELWEEAGALEIAVLEAGSMDLECLEEDLLDEDDRDYFKEHGIQTVFTVTIVPEGFDKLRPVMEKMMKLKGGYYCGDTKDFKPEIKLAE